MAAVAGVHLASLTVGDVTEPDTIDLETAIEDATDWLNATGYRHLPATEEGARSES